MNHGTVTSAGAANQAKPGPSPGRVLNTFKNCIQGIQESPKRAAAFKAAANKMGVKVTGIYWTLGPFDGVIVFEAPDGETATAAMLSLASNGNVQTTTTRAFDAGEFEKVVGILGKK